MTHKDARSVYERYNVTEHNIKKRDLLTYCRRRNARMELHHGGCSYADIARFESLLFGVSDDRSRIKHSLFPKKARPR